MIYVTSLYTFIMIVLSQLILSLSKNRVFGTKLMKIYIIVIFSICLSPNLYIHLL